MIREGVTDLHYSSEVVHHKSIMNNRTQRIRENVKQYWFLYMLAIPAIAFFVIFRFMPIIIQSILAFKDYQLKGGVLGSPWVGFDNFKAVMERPEFSTILMNTIEISLMRLGFGFFPPIILAIFLFDLHSTRLRRFSQSILYLPHFFSWVVIYGVIFALFSNTGLINSVLEGLSFEAKNFFLSVDWFRPLLIGSAIWKELGWGTIIYLAGLSLVDQSLYEAAKIDGAGPVRRLWHITLPAIRPLIIFLVTLSLGGILNAGAEQIILFYNPATYPVADVLDTWVYRQGLQELQYSLATATSLFQSMFGLLLVLLANKVSRKLAGVGLW